MADKTTGAPSLAKIKAGFDAYVRRVSVPGYVPTPTDRAIVTRLNMLLREYYRQLKEKENDNH